MSHPGPPSLQLLSLNVNGLRERQKRAALFAVLQAGPWHVIALQETHHATQAEAAHWCREGAGPTAPWDGPSFWAAGTSASRGVALLFKACPLLSGVSAYAADPCGRYVAAQGSLSGGHVTMASVYAPVERQERVPELTDGLSATACFQMSAQFQSQISSCQTIMGWQSRCHLPMHPPAAQGFGQCLLPSFPTLPSKPS